MVSLEISRVTFGNCDTYRAVTSKTAQRTYLYTILLVFTSSFLYGIAILGYLGFYNEYVPHQVRSAPVHLQYASPPSLPSTASTKAGSRLFAAEQALQQHLHSAPLHHPFALTDLRGLGLKTDQEYDLSVVLSVPRSPNNLEVGNFMVELALAASSVSSSSSAITAAARLPPANPRDFLESGGKRLLFAASRPGLMAYTDPLVAKATRLTLLPVHFFSPEAASRTRLIVPMAESLTFSGSGGPNAVLPAVLYLELRTSGEHELQTYGVEVVFSAKLRGLRWLMYHHRIFSFLLLTTMWWLIEVVAMVFMLVTLSVVFGGSRDQGYSTGRSDAGSSNGSLRHKPAKQIEPKKEEKNNNEEQKTPEKKTLDPALIKKEPSSAKKELSSIKKEPEEVTFGKETSKLAAIPPEAVATTKPAEKAEKNGKSTKDNKDTKDTKDAKDAKDARDSKDSKDSKGSKDTKDTKSTDGFDEIKDIKDTVLTASENKDKGKQNKASSRTSTPTPSKAANSRKSIINEPENDDDDFDDYDESDYGDEEDDAEPIIPPTPSRKQNSNKPQSQSRNSSPASPRKANKNKDSAVATGRAPSSPTDSTPAQQRPKKEASNLSTTSTASNDHGSPARKRMSQSETLHRPA
ncbi:hypothetical protein Sste5346_002791 [Sporothrix stenoceras]|uniref:Tubulin-tyrosine ligase n=1 Tax=Sporothrix stenoceras TaxID=5173 RepID=A0ABR3ZIP1_9PEZI